MADNISNVSRPDSYLIDLQVWGISNDSTNPLATSNGINNALQWAKNNGYTKISLPKGNYLVEKNTPIIPPSNIALNLNDSTLQIESNNLTHYSIINIQGKINVIVYGGVITGDKLSHDYSAGGDTWGNGIQINDSRNIKIDSMKIMNVPGTGIGAGSLLYNHISWIYLTDIESGTFDSKGNAIANGSFTRTNKYFSLSNTIINSSGFFSLYGNGYGSYGTDQNGKEIDLDLSIFTVYFYDNTGNYLGSNTQRTFDGVYADYFPKGATQFKIAFRYNYTNLKTSTMTLRANGYTNGLLITNCEIVGCRTLGIGLACVQNAIVENCEIHGVGGAAPGFGIDIEDGYNINQNIIIRNNHFHNNYKGSLVAVSTRNLLLEHNKFYGGVTMYGGRGQNYISQYNLYNCCTGYGSSAAGENGSNIIFNGDAFVETLCWLDGNMRYNNCSFDNTTFILSCTNFETVKFNDCNFTFDQADAGWCWELRAGTLVFEGCTFNINAVMWYYFRDSSGTNADKNNFTMNNCTVNSLYPISNGTTCDKLTLTNNKFIGSHDANYQYFNIVANQVVIKNNDIDSIPFAINARGTNPTKFIIQDNKISYTKTVQFNGPDRSEGFYVRKFDYIECGGNSVLLNPTAAGTNRIFTFFCEKLLKMHDNTIIALNAVPVCKIQLYPAYRVTGDVTPIPTLVSILESNYIKNITVEKTYASQLSKTEIGNGFIKLD